MEDKTKERLKQVSYICWAVGLTVSIYLGVDTRKHNFLTGLAFFLIILGIVLSIVKDRKKLR